MTIFEVHFRMTSGPWVTKCLAILKHAQISVHELKALGYEAYVEMVTE